jgi:hypothetical protein
VKTFRPARKIERTVREMAETEQVQAKDLHAEDGSSERRSIRSNAVRGQGSSFDVERLVELFQ